MGNCEKERDDLDLFKQTTSLWSHLNTPEMMASIISPLYEPNQGIIWPSVAPMSLVLWEGKFYNKLMTKNNVNILLLFFYSSRTLFEMGD